jgi:hypothetical protein
LGTETAVRPDVFRPEIEAATVSLLDERGLGGFATTSWANFSAVSIVGK